MSYIQSAQLFGIVSILLALGVLFNLDHSKQMAEELVNSVSGYILAGVLPTIFGTWILTLHSDWSPGWHVLVLVIGWLMLLSGVMRLWFVRQWKHWMNQYLDKLPVLFALFGLMLGCVLAYVGFVSHHF